MKSIIKPLRDIGFLTIALTMALVANFAYGQWANPTAAPVGGNVSLPINTSTVTQTKLGNFGAINVFSAATTTAGDAMHSPLYCDENGANCVPSTGLGGGGTLNGGPGIVGYMRNQGHTFPAPPQNLSEWPDWVYCARGLMPFRAAGGSVVYGSWPIGDNYVGAVHFNTAGNQTFNNVGSCGSSNIREICQSGRCGFYNGGAPASDSSLVCNAYGCSSNGACSSAGCPAVGESCNQYGCSSGGSCTAYGCP